MSKAVAIKPANRWSQMAKEFWVLLKMPALAILMAFIIGGVVIWVTSGSLTSVWEAYSGLVRGAFFKQRGFSETLVASVPYVLLALGLAVGFKTGLFNIGVEGQFTIGSICAAWAGAAISGLPAIIHLPLALLAGALGGAVWAAIPGYLKARTGAHEVISTMMMNYVAFRLGEYMVSIPLRDPNSTGVQTRQIASAAELWTMQAIPQRLQDPLNALLVAIIFAALSMLLVRALLKAGRFAGAAKTISQHRITYISAGIIIGLLVFVGLPPLTKLWWPFTDQYDRLHTGIFLAVFAAIGVWWLLWKTTLGFELRTVGANPNAAQYAGVNITRSIILSMGISGALAGLAGTVEVVGVSICRCLPLFFSSGYGWDSIGIALLAKNNPFGILAASLLFGAMRNGADLMELSSGVSKYIISLIQALVLLFVAAPAIVRWIYRIRESSKADDAPLKIGSGRKAMTTNNGVKPRLNLRGMRWITTTLLIAFGLVAIWVLLNLVIGGKCEQKCVIDTLAQTLRVVTPIAFAALCGVMCERSGIFNIGIEGQMLMAAMVGYAVNLFTYQWLKDILGLETAANVSRLLALLLGVVSAVLLAWIHALVSIKFKVDQVISGTVINILSIGITGFIYRQFLSQNLPPGPGTYPLISIPLLSKIPFIGPILFVQKPLTYMMLLAVIFIHYMLFHTPWGLRTRAIGEHPRAADTLGVNVIRMQYINVLWGGVLAGLGGLWFTLEAVDVFNPMMTNGLGFIGLAAMIFGNYTPFGALAGALIFGLGSSVTATISIFRPDIPSQFPQMLPYLLTIIILTGVVGKAKPPAAGGKVYEKQ